MAEFPSLRAARLRNAPSSVINRKGTAWWAESPDVAGFTAGGDSLTEARELARDGVAFFFDDPDLDIHEQLANGGLVSHGHVESTE